MKGVATVGVLLAALADDPNTSPIVKVQERYFDVTGSTAKELKAAIRRLGPQGQHAGSAEWKIAWAFDAEKVESGYAVSRVVTTVDVTITLPQWTNSSESDSDLRFWWNLCLRDARLYAQAYVDRGIATAKDIEQAVLKLPPASDCQTLQAHVARTANAVLEEARRKEAGLGLRSAYGIAGPMSP